MDNRPVAQLETVAARMVELLRKKQLLSQRSMADAIWCSFRATDDFLHRCQPSGKPRFSTAVLKRFKQLSPDVVWIEPRKTWRLRNPTDGPGRKVRY